MSQVFIIETTCGPKLEAEHLAKSMVEEGFSPCCHMISIRSCYRWKGTIEEADELLLRWKVAEKNLSQAIAHIKANHSYEVPEVLVTQVTCENPSYGQWLERGGMT